MNRKPITGTPRIIWIAVLVLALIGVAVVIRRVLTMAGVIPPVAPSGTRPFDTGFARHPALTLVHILPGILFMVLGPLQFVKGLRSRHPAFHRYSGRVFMISAYIIGISALVMPFITMPIGGLNEVAASTLYALFFLCSLTMAWRHIIRKETARHREWMIRAFSIGLAVATVRPIMGMFFAFSSLPPQVFFGTAFWIGFTLHLIAAEAWIRITN